MDSERPGHDGELRSKVCEAHGLRYDPQTQAGCVRCRQESSDSIAGGTGSSRRGGPPLVVWLIVAGLVLLLAAWMFGGGGAEELEVASSRPSAERPSTNSAGPSRESQEEREDSGAGDLDTFDLANSPATVAGWPTHEAVGEITIEDPPEDEPFRVDELEAPDLRSVSFRASGGALSITLEFTASLEGHAFDFAAGIEPAVVFVDTDLDASTGEEGFAGRPGFEWAIPSYLGVKYATEDESYFWAGGVAETPIVEFACSHDVGTVSGVFLDLTFDPSDEAALENTSCYGSTLEVRVPYELLHVSAGQTVRLATQESMGSGKRPQYFLADAILTLE